MIVDVLKYLDRYKTWRQVTVFLDRIGIGSKKTPLFEIIKIFFISLEKDDIIERAKAVAYNFTMAIFPAVLVLFTLIPYIPIPDLQETVMHFMEDLDLSMIEAVRSTVEDIITRPRGGLLSFGLIFSLYLSTNGMLSLITTFNHFYKTKYSRGYFRSWAIAFFLTIQLILVLTIANILLIGGEIILNFLLDFGVLNKDFLLYLIIGLRFVLLVLMFQLMISLIYYFGPSVEDRFSFINPGSVIATFLTIAVSYGFSFYLTNLASYNKFYGSIGAVIAFMIWLFLLSVILLLGYVINASIDRANREDYVNI
ncbi:MAG: YihY/virulence factor BrkB family protein [Cyclobacteriaceae bacterium]|nr:YihY/virulence factor BrkB family protein [Cyclobacteriaceae bacterium]